MGWSRGKVHNLYLNPSAHCEAETFEVPIIVHRNEPKVNHTFSNTLNSSRM
jgi:hypothetical protein